MKLSRNTEYAIVAAIIAYVAFFPRIPAVTKFVSNPVGKAMYLAGVVYVWKCVSALVALLLVVAYVRCTSGSGMIWEGMSNPAKCTCPSDFIYNPATGLCKKADGSETAAPTTCACEPGFSYDVMAKECKQNSVMSSPLPPAPPESMETTSTAAPANAPPPPGPTSTAPVTTPGAAQDMATSTPPATSGSTTVTPSTTESFTLAGYPLY